MIAEIVGFVKANPLLAVAGSAVVASLFSRIQKLPSQGIGLLQKQVSVTLTVWSEDSFIFETVNRWLALHPDTKKMRSFTLSRWWDRANQSDELALAPGSGHHLIRHDKRYFLIHRDVMTAAGSQSQRQQTLSITTWGRNSEPLARLLDSICATSNNADSVAISVWVAHGYTYLGQKDRRSFDSIYMDSVLKATMIKDIEDFLKDREWYKSRSIPYRRGLLLTGPPGTGKTSAIIAMASLTGKGIYILNPAAINNDNELLNAVNSAGKNIIVIEDIESSRGAQIRGGDEPATTVEAVKAGITPSGWLNALDGIGARDGRLVIATTNHPERLDPAIIRAGRFDKIFAFEPADYATAAVMAMNFYPNRFLGDWLDGLSYPIPQAELQELLLGLRGEMVGPMGLEEMPVSTLRNGSERSYYLPPFERPGTLAG